MSEFIREDFGHVHFTEAFIARKHYETASWWTDIEVPAGKYRLTLLWQTGDAAPYPYWVVTTFPGKVVASHFENRLFCAQSSVDNEDVGTSAVYSYQTGAYCVAGEVGTKHFSLGWWRTARHYGTPNGEKQKTHGRITLDEGWKVVPTLADSGTVLWRFTREDDPGDRRHWSARKTPSPAHTLNFTTSMAKLRDMAIANGDDAGKITLPQMRYRIDQQIKDLARLKNEIPEEAPLS